MTKQVFISYSTKDRLKVKNIKRHLESVGISCWMAEESVRSGEQFKSIIVHAIKSCEVFVFCSSKSANASEWTIKEINTAVHLCKPIVPIKLDNSPYNDSILFDIGALDYVNLSSVSKFMEGVEKLQETLFLLLKNEKIIPVKRKSLKSYFGGGIAILTLLLLLIIFAFIRLYKTRVQKYELYNGDIMFAIDNVQFKMIRVKGGTFMMGSDYREADQSPQHEVTLFDYYLAETEVTQELWAKVTGDDEMINKDRPCLPARNVSWSEAVAFVEELNKLTNENFQLPTEAQWEYAARGGENGTDTLYAASDLLSEVTKCVSDFGQGSELMPVAMAGIPNRLGLYDMTGNVWEWCMDKYGDYVSSSVTNPIGTNEGDKRVKRGGSWRNKAKECVVTFRGSADEKQRRIDYGLRLCLDAE